MPFSVSRSAPRGAEPWDARADIGPGVFDPEGHPRGRDGRELVSARGGAKTEGFTCLLVRFTGLCVNPLDLGPWIWCKWPEPGPGTGGDRAFCWVGFLGLEGVSGVVSGGTQERLAGRDDGGVFLGPGPLEGSCAKIENGSLGVGMRFRFGLGLEALCFQGLKAVLLIGGGYGDSLLTW